jgi:hypothetical protein
LPSSITANLVLREIDRTVDSMPPHESRPELLRSESPISLSAVVESLPELNRKAILDDRLNSLDLSRRTILSMEWDCTPGGSSSVSVEAIDLPNGRSAFFAFGALDLADQLSEPDFLLLAASTAACTSEVETAFLEELLRTNGEAFGVVLMSSAPTSLGCTYDGDRTTLVDTFVECLLAASKWGTEPLESLEQHVELATDEDDEYDLKASVASYLESMLGPE